MVLATDPPSAVPAQACDPKLLEKIPPEIQIVRIPHGNPLVYLLAMRDLLSLAFGRGGIFTTKRMLENPIGSNIDMEKPVSGTRKLGQFIVDSLANFPDPQCHWFRPAVRAMSRMPVNERPDLIFATGTPWTSLLVGRRLAKIFGVPWVADFRDPWAGRYGYKFFSSKILSLKASSLERAVCAEAARVILNTEELGLWFCSKYPEWQHKFTSITNGYADELQPAQVHRGVREEIVTKDGTEAPTLELCHFGTIYGNRSPTALFRAVHELLSERTMNASRLRLRFVGAWDVEDQECTQLAKSLEERGLLRRAPPVPHQECLKEMARSDVLLILQPDYPMQIPAKIYEYIVAGRPLLVLGGEGATANLVQRNRLGRCCPNRVQDIKQMLASLLSNTMVLTIPSPTDSEKFSYRILSKRLADLFDGVLAEQPR